MNARGFPGGLFALIEQRSKARSLGVSAVEIEHPPERERPSVRGGVALATEPPKTRFISRAAEEIVYAARANRVALHRGDETIAVIEIVSPGNKSSAAALQQFVEKSSEFLERGIHLLVVDLFPPSRRDPKGVHPLIWEGINSEPFVLPEDKPLTLASYVAGPGTTAYVDPVAVGDRLPEMPVFLDTKTYVRVPLEETYDATWKTCPEEFRQRVTGGNGSS